MERLGNLQGTLGVLFLASMETVSLLPQPLHRLDLSLESLAMFLNVLQQAGDSCLLRGVGLADGHAYSLLNPGSRAPVQVKGPCVSCCGHPPAESYCSHWPRSDAEGLFTTTLVLH